MIYEYRVGKVYQDEYSAGLFAITKYIGDYKYEVYCENGDWEGVYDSLNEELYIPYTGKTVKNFNLISLFKDIGYGYFGKGKSDG